MDDLLEQGSGVGTPTSTAPASGTGQTITAGWHTLVRVCDGQQVRQYVDGLRTNTTATTATGGVPQRQAQKEVTANAALDALDQAIAGLLEIDVSAGGTVTAEPAAALNRKMLRLTGTHAADAEVVVPDNRKPYFLHNATAGGFAVMVRTAAGAGVVVGASPDGTAVVYCDGTDLLAIGFGGEEGAHLPYDPAMFIPGTHGSGALMAQIVFPRAATFPAAFAGSQPFAQIAATASTMLDLQRNSISTAASGSVPGRAAPPSPWPRTRSSTRIRPMQPSPICPSPRRGADRCRSC